MALAIAIALVAGVEITSINILTTFLAELRGFAQAGATTGLILYLVGKGADPTAVTGDRRGSGVWSGVVAP